jgi:hypothetical protein
LAQGPISGIKKSKNRITVLLTCNATGNDYIKPLIIHKFKNPRALNGKPKKDFPVEYYWNSTAWMQITVWHDYLKKLDTSMHQKNKKILLLVDNAPTHSSCNLNLTHVTIEFLLPNTTAHLQPLDAGIINSFKVFLILLLYI